jgi:hypothetical protein
MRLDSNVIGNHYDLVDNFFSHSVAANTTTCMQPIYRTAYSKNYNFRSRFLQPKVFSCQEMLFLPLVYFQTDTRIQANDRLECRGNVEGFHHPCPELRSKDDTSSVECHRLILNRDCLFLENSLRGRCSASQTCDYVSIPTTCDILLAYNKLILVAPN